MATPIQYVLSLACLVLVISLLFMSPARAQYPGGGSGSGYPGSGSGGSGYPGGSGGGGSGGSGSGGGYPGGSGGYPGGDHWDITYEANGTAIGPQTNYAWTAPPANTSDFGYGTGSPQAGDFSNSGTITITFTWVSQTGAHPPEGIYAKITSKAFADCGTYNPNLPVGTGDADDGFGDPPPAGFTGPGAESVGMKVKDIGWTTSNHLVGYKVVFSPKAHVYGTTYGTTQIFLGAAISSSPN